MKNEIKKVVIYSVGLLGGSFGLALKQSGFTGEIIGISSRKGIDGALSVGAIDKGYGYDQIEEVVKDADLIILASPINGILDAIQKLSKINLPDNLLISDVGSTKEKITEVAEKFLPDNVSFIGGHPMAGSEKSGPQASDAFLFENAIYVLTESNKTKENDIEDFSDFLSKMLNCRVVTLKAATHDKIAATISHVPHLVAVALVNMAAKVESEIDGTLDLAAGGFKSLTRIASSPYGMWNDIYESNKESTLEILDKYIDELKITRKALVDRELEEKFNSASETRKAITVNKKGFLLPLHEIVVVAEDKPGFLSKITTILYEAKMNIRDFELLKIREGEAGTFMFAFSTEEEANKAIDVLAQHNFISRRR